MFYGWWNTASILWVVNAYSEIIFFFINDYIENVLCSPYKN